MMMQLHFGAAAKRHGLTLEEVRSPRRDRVACRAREEAYAACVANGFTLTQIGQYVKRDHTTILNGLRRYRMRQK
jgi:chromosomal replication initiation ATPase DnaA